MTKKCERCGRFMDPQRFRLCHHCAIMDMIAWKTEYFDQMKTEPNQREDAMKEVKAGQTWEVEQFWANWDAGHRLLVIGRHPEATNLLVVQDDEGYHSVSDRMFEKYCKLLKDEHSDPVEPPKPDEVETPVVLDSFGALQMGTPNDGFTWAAQQGVGQGGWTCIGFRFKESPPRIFPWAQGWLSSSNPRFGVYDHTNSTFDTHVVAEKAVWRKLGS